MNQSSSYLFFRPSIQPKHKPTSTASSYVKLGAGFAFFPILTQIPGEDS